MTLSLYIFSNGQYFYVLSPGALHTQFIRKYCLRNLVFSLYLAVPAKKHTMVPQGQFKIVSLTIGTVWNPVRLCSLALKALAIVGWLFLNGGWYMLIHEFIPTASDETDVVECCGAHDMHLLPLKHVSDELSRKSIYVWVLGRCT